MQVIGGAPLLRHADGCPAARSLEVAAEEDRAWFRRNRGSVRRRPVAWGERVHLVAVFGVPVELAARSDAVIYEVRPGVRVRGFVDGAR